MRNLDFYLLLFFIGFLGVFQWENAIGQEDTIPPIVTLLGHSFIVIPCEGNYTEFGANAVDNVDGTLAVERGGDFVCVYNEGTYFVTYTATDISGNTASVLRIVRIEGDCHIDCGVIDDFEYPMSFKTQNDTTQTALNTPIIIPVLENDCCNPLFVSISKKPNFGTANVVEGQAIEYMPDEGFIGVDTFKYTTTNWWWTGPKSAWVFIEIGTTNISQSLQSPQFQLFPNPTQQTLHIDIGTELAAKKNLQLSLFNTLGQLEGKYALSISENSTLEVGNLPRGLYVYQLEEEGKILANGKLVLE